MTKRTSSSMATEKVALKKQEQILKKVVQALELMTFPDRVTPSSPAKAPQDRAVVLTNVLALVGNFAHNSSKDATFKLWFKPNDQVLQSYCESDNERAQIVLRARGPEEYRQLCARISPRAPEDVPFKDLTTLLEDMFEHRRSLFRRRHDTILIDRLPAGMRCHELVDHANLKGDEFEFDSLTLTQFKVFILLLSISDSSYQSIRSVIMRAVDEKPDISIDNLRQVLERYEARTSDAKVDVN